MQFTAAPKVESSHILSESGFPILSGHQEVPPPKFTQMSHERRSTVFAVCHRLSTIWAGERKALRIDLVGKLHRENTTLLRFWIGVPTAAGSITTRSKALNSLDPTAGANGFAAATQLQQLHFLQMLGNINTHFGSRSILKTDPSLTAQSWHVHFLLLDSDTWLSKLLEVRL